MPHHLSKSAVARYLVDAARQAPSADNSQPFDFVWDGNALSIRFSQERGGKGIFGASAHATVLAFGTVIECMDQAAAAANIRLSWRWEDPSAGVFAQAGIDGDVGVVGLPRGLPLFERHTNRFPYKRSPIPEATIDELVHRTEGEARVNVLTPGGDFGRLVDCIRTASESRFCTEELHNWLIGSLRLDAEAAGRGDGLDVATLNLPPGGGLFMRVIADWQRMKALNRFGLFKFLAMTETQLLAQAPAMFCLIGKEGISNTIDAGRLLARIWIELNSLGLAVHPYYVLTDQLIRMDSDGLPVDMIDRMADVRHRLPAIIGTGQNEMLHMLLRVGLPKRAVPRSKRLPLERVYSDRS